MRKILCMLMFGMVFGQDAITTREITISIDENTEMIDIGNHIDLVSGYYYVEVIHSNQNSDLICQECGSVNISFTTNLPYWGVDNLISWETMGCGSYEFNNYWRYTFSTISYDNSIFILDQYSNYDNCSFDMDVILHISGKFNEDIGLQGDMNNDDSLDVLDVVVMVEIILDGGIGDVGNLLNIVKG